MAAKKTVKRKAATAKAAAMTAAATASTTAPVVATEVKEETKPAAEAVKKETGKVEATKEKTAKKPAAKKTAKKQEVYIQFGGREVLEAEVLDKVKKAWTELGNKVGDMLDVKVYIKPEEFKAYYVINGDVTGSVEL